MTILEKLIASLKSVENIDKLTTIENSEAKQNVNLVVGRYKDDYFVLTGFGVGGSASQYNNLSEFKYVEAEEFVERISEIIEIELGVNLESCHISLYLYELLLVGELKPVLSDSEVDVNYSYLIDSCYGNINLPAATSFYVEQALQGKGLTQGEIDQITFAISLQLDPILEQDEIRMMLDGQIENLDEILEDLGGFAKIVEEAQEKAQNLKIISVEYQGERFEIVSSEVFDEIGNYQQGLEIYSLDAFGNRFIQIGSFFEGQAT